jgi:ESS family glutamate:Na+ symporter
MVAFFATIGFNASVSLLKVSGRHVAIFLVVAGVFAVVQCVVGIVVSLGFGLNPLFGVLAGSTTLAGGPATGLAFAPLFEQAGVTGAQSIAVAAAMAGIISGGIIGGPVATWLVERNRLKPAPIPGVSVMTAEIRYSQGTSAQSPEAAMAASVAEDVSDEGSVYAVLKGMVLVLVALWAGSYLSAGFSAAGITLPGYIGAMLVGSLIRNIDDFTGWFRLPRELIENIGNVSLAFFLAMALMNLKLWELSGLALPLLVNLAVQVLLVAAFCLWPLFQIMGKDYDAAVMGGGFIGFMLGTTANAMAVMRTLVERYGPAPRAFLVAPLVGAFFIDFINALVITTFLNIYS